MLAFDLTVLYDPAGDGRAAVAVGDVATAAHISVIVPGTGTELDDFSGTIKNMRNLGSDNHAVVAWLGYDTSSDIPREGMKGYAEPGTTALAPFVGGLRAVNIRQAEVTVMGHSYGSTVAGMGRHRRHGANRLIVVGSPGHAPGPAEE